MNMKVLVLGSKGQLGCCLSDQLSKTDYKVVYSSRADFDISELSSLNENISLIRPNIVINASAYTAVDMAEDDKEIADLINHRAVAKLASVCKAHNTRLIHVSTDYVFDGTATKPYSENDKTNPQGIYGESKLNGELAIKRSGCDHTIIRTAWVFSEHGNNFLKTMLMLGSNHDELNIVGDQIGCPTYAQDLAKAIVTMLPSFSSKTSTSGIFHYCGDNACSWYEFAQAIFAEAKTFGLKTPSRINSIDSTKYPTRAMRPAYSVLACSKIDNTFGIAPSSWRDGIKSVLEKVHKEIKFNASSL
jgi:dTDP-4-dehydrorhamnose reductase